MRLHKTSPLLANKDDFDYFKTNAQTDSNGTTVCANFLYGISLLVLRSSGSSSPHILKVAEAEKHWSKQPPGSLPTL